MPPTSVYFVCPRRMASTAASLMRCGVSKSGSPAPNEITSIPLARSSLALACTARVEDGASVFSRSASTWVLLARRGPRPRSAGGASLSPPPLLDGEQRRLGGIGADGHDHLVEDLQAPLDDVHVAVVQRIEHPRIDGALAHFIGGLDMAPKPPIPRATPAELWRPSTSRVSRAVRRSRGDPLIFRRHRSRRFASKSRQRRAGRSGSGAGGAPSER